MPHLQLCNVSLAYPGHTVVEDFSLSLEQGQIACLLGPSGCGKTTVLRAIAGFEPLAAGSIRLDGRTVADRDTAMPPERRRIGMVFQDYALFPHLTVAHNVGFGLPRKDVAAWRTRVWALLETVGLAGEADKYPHELSGGQQQRVALARALAPAPALLLLDEPFSNLDVELRERLSLEVRAILKRTHTTAILVTHDQREAFAVADEIGLMQDGRLQQWDTPQGLYFRPANRFVASFIGDGVLLRGEVADGGVRTELGTLAVHAPLPARAAVEVLLRPEDVVPAAEGISATLCQHVFHGSHTLLELELASGQRVLSRCPSHAVPAAAPGAAICIRLADTVYAAFPV